jgi:hypothetical protein
MTAIGIQAQFVKVLHKVRSNWVEVNVADQFQEIDILLAKYRLETVLEKVAMSAMGPIEPEGMTCQ